MARAFLSLASVALFLATLPGCADRAQADIAMEQKAQGASVAPRCLFSGGKLLVFTILDVDYTMLDFNSPTPGAMKKSKGRILWKALCEQDGSCTALFFDLDHLDRGEGISEFDIVPVEDAEIVSRTGSVFTIQWGGLRTFTVDLAANRVDYRESGPTTEGRGSGSCSKSGL